MSKLQYAVLVGVLLLGGGLVFSDNTVREIWRFHNVQSAVPATCSVLFQGDTYYDTDTTEYFVCNGSAWRQIGASKSPDGNPWLGVDVGILGGATDLDNVLEGNGVAPLMTGGATDNVCVGDGACPTLVNGDENVTVGADSGPANYSGATTLGSGLTAKADGTVSVGVAGDMRLFANTNAVALTESTATSLIRFSVTQESWMGAVVAWTVVAADANDEQTLTGISEVNATNDGGTEDCDVETLGGTGESSSSGTLAMEAAPTCTSGAADTVDFKLDMVSSLTQTTLNAYYTVLVLGPATTLTPQ